MTTAPCPISLLIADDQALLRRSLATILGSQPDLLVVGEAKDGAEAVALTRSHRPDVVLMDIHMPGALDGIAATRLICADPALASTRVSILTMFDADAYVFQALRAGASGFLLKDTPPDGVIDAVRSLHAGNALLSPAVLRTVSAHCPPGVRPAASIDGLTRRQGEILQLIATGLSNAEIGETLSISHSTLKSHISALLQRLGARDRAQLVIAAYESGVVSPGP